MLNFVSTLSFTNTIEYRSEIEFAFGVDAPAACTENELGKLKFGLLDFLFFFKRWPRQVRLDKQTDGRTGGRTDGRTDRQTELKVVGSCRPEKRSIR